MLTALDRFRWLEAVLCDSSLTNAEKLVAVRIALHHNLENGKCFASNETLGRGTALCTRAVKAALTSLTRDQWMEIPNGRQGGRGLANDFAILTARLDAPAEWKRVHGDAPFVEETVQNSAGNGAKFTGKG